MCVFSQIWVTFFYSITLSNDIMQYLDYCFYITYLFKVLTLLVTISPYLTKLNNIQYT